MSRLEEVDKTMEELKDTIAGLDGYRLSDKQITNMNLASIVTLLVQISISMAMIADSLAESEDKE